MRGFGTHHLALGQERTPQGWQTSSARTQPASAAEYEPAESHGVHPESERRLEGAGGSGCQGSTSWSTWLAMTAVFTEENRETPAECIPYGRWLRTARSATASGQPNGWQHPTGGSRGRGVEDHPRCRRVRARVSVTGGR